jgi:hypothetical protein
MVSVSFPNGGRHASQLLSQSDLPLSIEPLASHWRSSCFAENSMLDGGSDGQSETIKL